MAKKFEHVGGGKFDVYKEKKTDYSGVVAWMIVIGVVLAVIF